MSSDCQISAVGYSPEPNLRNSPRPIKRRWWIAHRAILELDRTLRRFLGIFEFSTNGDCLLRIAMTRAKTGVALPDGTQVHSDDWVVDLHFWNEHLAEFLAMRPPLARAKLMSLRLHSSFKLLADYVSTHPELAKAKFFHARVVMPIGHRFNTFEAVAHTHGFRVTTPQARGITRVHDFFEGFLVRALVWAFNRTRRKRRFRPLQRVDLWSTRAEFLCRYLPSTAYSANPPRLGSLNLQESQLRLQLRNERACRPKADSPLRILQASPSSSLSMARKSANRVRTAGTHIVSGATE
jgi:hypothetical protein